MMSNGLDLAYTLAGLNFLFFAVSTAILIHLWDKTSKQSEQIRELKTTTEIARDRVTHLYDQVNRVETRVDVTEHLQEIVEAVTSSQQND